MNTASPWGKLADVTPDDGRAERTDRYVLRSAPTQQLPLPAYGISVHANGEVQILQIRVASNPGFAISSGGIPVETLEEELQIWAGEARQCLSDYEDSLDNQ
jgi:hypothetical protein